jgi:hypothetical protein
MSRIDFTGIDDRHNATEQKRIVKLWMANLEHTDKYHGIEIFYRSNPIAYILNVVDIGEDIGDNDPDEIDVEARTTARLMAAAPELLEALEKLLYFVDTPEMIEAAKNAIIKARGFL